MKMTGPTKETSSKRKQRLENKKKKMAAYLDIAKLNEYDRQKNKLHRKVNLIEESTGCGDNNTVITEPSPKKLKTENTQNLIENHEDSSASPPLLGASGKPLLNGEAYLEMKKKLREKTNQIRNIPKFRLREMGERAALSVSLDERCPLFLSDLQHLIMYALLGPHSPYSPTRWCALEKYNRLKTVNVVIVENVSLYHYENFESHFPFLREKFEIKVEFVSPASYSDIVKELSLFPLTATQIRKIVTEYGSLEEAEKKCSAIFNTVNNFFPIYESIDEDDISKNNNVNGFPASDKFSRTQLLLSGWQMIEENFPLPIKGLYDRKYPDYRLTKDKYKSVTSNSPLIGIDCEMCRTETGDLELTRISAVNEDHSVFYDTLVKPDNKITDYLTKYSGINSKMLKNVKTKLKDVQEYLRKTLPDDAILVGQSLSNDLHAIKMMHPYIIDTSVIYNITGDRLRKTKLQTLAREFLHEKIQLGNQGHCSTEDSLAAMKLVQLKLKKHPYFGDATMGSNFNEIRAYPDMGSSNYARSMLKECTKIDKKASVVGVDKIGEKYEFFVDKNEVKNNKNQANSVVCSSEKSNKEVVQIFMKNVEQYSLNIAHLRIAETSLNETSTFDTLDQWIGQIFNKLEMPNMTLVIFGGQKEGGNGVGFIQLSREYIQ